MTIVGLPETEVKESKDRVRAALQNARFEFPARRITVNLAPADLPKESGRFVIVYEKCYKEDALETVS
jgi:magnesium chelatase family protein